MRRGFKQRTVDEAAACGLHFARSAAAHPTSYLRLDVPGTVSEKKLFACCEIFYNASVTAGRHYT